VNEGGANFVFRFQPVQADAGLPAILDRKILRLRKHTQGTKLDSAQVLRNFESEWLPLFPAENLVQQDLIGLETTIIEWLNEHLTAVPRAAHRTQDVLADHDKGLLITDMTPDEGELLLELKPKWLAQSPHAPSDARRCRTCALRAQRAAEKEVITATDAQNVCPLSLVADSAEIRAGAASQLIEDEALQKYVDCDHSRC